MYQPIVNNAPVGPLKQNPKTSYDDDDKGLISLDVKERETIGNSLHYHVYHLVQNYKSTQEMMEMLTVAYEDTLEVQLTTINSFNQGYKKFFD